MGGLGWQHLALCPFFLSLELDLFLIGDLDLFLTEETYCGTFRPLKLLAIHEKVPFIYNIVK